MSPGQSYCDDRPWPPCPSASADSHCTHFRRWPSVDFTSGSESPHSSFLSVNAYNVPQLSPYWKLHWYYSDYFSAITTATRLSSSPAPLLSHTRFLQQSAASWVPITFRPRPTPLPPPVLWQSMHWLFIWFWQNPPYRHHWPFSRIRTPHFRSKSFPWATRSWPPTTEFWNCTPHDW